MILKIILRPGVVVLGLIELAESYISLEAVDEKTRKQQAALP